ncbi:MAG: 30S ribosomal protein S16 [Candidatus Limnocylindria bacterium]
MAVKIRLTRVGATKRPAYRVVAADSRTARDGRPLEIIGFYDPLTEPATVRLDAEKLERWIGRGAKPTDIVSRLMRQAGIGADASAATAATQPETAAKPRRAPRKPAT